jgi:hypothetical protein
MRTRPEPSVVLIKYWSPIWSYRPAKRLIGHLVDRGHEAEAFDKSDHSLGTYATLEEAIAAIHCAHQDARPEHVPPNQRHLSSQQRQGLQRSLRLALPTWTNEAA